MFRCSGLCGNFELKDHQIAISAGSQMANYVRSQRRETGTAPLFNCFDGYAFRSKCSFVFFVSWTSLIVLPK